MKEGLHMYCPNCMKEIPNTANFCTYCAQPTHTPVAGMATLRISCNQKEPLIIKIYKIFCPLLFLIKNFYKYYVYISIDDQNYVLNSKDKQMDIPVPIGTHYVRISSMSKKQAKAWKIGGGLMRIGGAAMGSGSTVYGGALMEDIGNSFSNDGAMITFESNELITIGVRAAWTGLLEEDK